jgi:hypothetical protein
MLLARFALVLAGVGTLYLAHLLLESIFVELGLTLQLPAATLIAYLCIEVVAGFLLGLALVLPVRTSPYGWRRAVALGALPLLAVIVSAFTSFSRADAPEFLLRLTPLFGGGFAEASAVLVGVAVAAGLSGSRWPRSAAEPTATGTIDRSSRAREEAEGRSIFVSYPRSHFYLAESLARGLELDGHDVWFDAERLGPASDWESEIREALGSADALVLVASPSAFASTYVTAELRAARDAAKPVYVAVAERVPLPTELRHSPVFDVRTRFTEKVRRISEAIRSDRRSGQPAPGPSVARPLPVWIVSLALFSAVLFLLALGVATVWLIRGDEVLAGAFEDVRFALLGRALVWIYLLGTYAYLWFAFVRRRFRWGQVRAMLIAFPVLAWGIYRPLEGIIDYLQHGGSLAQSLALAASVLPDQLLFAFLVVTVLVWIAFGTMGRSRSVYRWLPTGEAPETLRRRIHRSLGVSAPSRPAAPTDRPSSSRPRIEGRTADDPDRPSILLLRAGLVLAGMVILYLSQSLWVSLRAASFFKSVPLGRSVTYLGVNVLAGLLCGLALWLPLRSGPYAWMRVLSVGAVPIAVSVLAVLATEGAFGLGAAVLQRFSPLSGGGLVVASSAAVGLALVAGLQSARGPGDGQTTLAVGTYSIKHEAADAVVGRRVGRVLATAGFRPVPTEEAETSVAIVSNQSRKAWLTRTLSDRSGSSVVIVASSVRVPLDARTFYTYQWIDHRKRSAASLRERIVRLRGAGEQSAGHLPTVVPERLEKVVIPPTILAFYGLLLFLAALNLASGLFALFVEGRGAAGLNAFAPVGIIIGAVLFWLGFTLRSRSVRLVVFFVLLAASWGAMLLAGFDNAVGLLYPQYQVGSINLMTIVWLGGWGLALLVNAYLLADWLPTRITRAPRKEKLATPHRDLAWIAQVIAVLIAMTFLYSEVREL